MLAAPGAGSSLSYGAAGEIEEDLGLRRDGDEGQSRADRPHGRWGDSRLAAQSINSEGAGVWARPARARLPDRW